MNKENFISNSVLRQIGYIVVCIILAGVILYNISTFLSGFLGAICMYMLLLHPLRWLHIKNKWNITLSVIVLMLVMSSIIFFPIYLLINLLTKKLSLIFTHKDEIEITLKNAVSKIHNSFGIDILNEKYLSNVAEISANMIQSIVNTTFDSIIQLLIALFILFFMLINYKELENWFLQNVPLKKNNLSSLNKKLKGMIISNAVGVPLVSLLQACVALIGFLIIGLPDAFSWFILMIFAGMVPVVGTALVYIPAVIVMIANGQVTEGYILLAFCILIVGSVDNVFRFLIQKKMADVHPLITVFGVILGVNLFGFIGIIFGPILFSLLFWMFNLYKLEFIDNEVEQKIED